MYKTIRIALNTAAIVALALLAGCESKDQKALDQAKAQAIATNVPQQVQYVNGSGYTVTKTVEPPASKGQDPAVSTLTTPPPPGPKPQSTDPVITPLGSVAPGRATTHGCEWSAGVRALRDDGGGDGSLRSGASRVPPRTRGHRAGYSD